jgi:hypothetical protein
MARLFPHSTAVEIDDAARYESGAQSTVVMVTADMVTLYGKGFKGTRMETDNLDASINAGKSV